MTNSGYANKANSGPENVNHEELNPATSLDDLKRGIERLAKLSPLEYATERKKTAKRFDFSVTELDNQVKIARKLNAGPKTIHQSQQTWPDPVNGPQLFNEIDKLFAQHIIFKDYERHICILWCAFTHTVQLFDIAPNLLITSGVPDCGKTSLLSLTAALAHNSIAVSSASSAAIPRLMDRGCYTLFLDEADTYLIGNKEMLGVINSSHGRRTGSKLTNVRKEDTNDWEPGVFKTFGPKAISGLGTFPAPLVSRSFVIKLMAALPNQRVEELTDERLAQVTIMGQKLARWFVDSRHDIASNVADLPNLSNRAKQNFKPLFQIAMAIDDTWLQRVKNASELLPKATRKNDDGRQLLIDIRYAFLNYHEQRYNSTQLVEVLNSIDTSPWQECGKGGQPLTTRGLALLLEPFGIEPRHSSSGNYYDRDQFKDAFVRNLSDDAK